LTNELRIGAAGVEADRGNRATDPFVDRRAIRAISRPNVERLFTRRTAFRARFGNARNRILIIHRTTRLRVTDCVFVGVRDERATGARFAAGIAANVLL
jgi:hypothetical protein